MGTNLKKLLTCGAIGAGFGASFLVGNFFNYLENQGKENLQPTYSIDITKDNSTLRIRDYSLDRHNAGLKVQVFLDGSNVGELDRGYFTLTKSNKFYGPIAQDYREIEDNFAGRNISLKNSLGKELASKRIPYPGTWKTAAYVFLGQEAKKRKAALMGKSGESIDLFEDQTTVPENLEATLGGVEYSISDPSILTKGDRKILTNVWRNTLLVERSKYFQDKD